MLVEGEILNTHSLRAPIVWDIIDTLKWNKDHDYARCQAEIMDNLSPQAAEEFGAEVRSLAANVMKAIDMWEKQTHKSVGVGDDGFSDLCYHIVGCGQTEYERVLADPSLAHDRANRGDFRESFAYALPDRADYEKKTEAYYVKEAQELMVEWVDTQSKAMLLVPLGKNFQDGDRLRNQVETCFRQVRTILTYLIERYFHKIDKGDVEVIKANMKIISEHTDVICHHGVENLVHDFLEIYKR